jgi:hypothetical protein
VPLEVSNNAMEFSTDAVIFQYTDELQISELVPASGPLNGDTLVTINGANFVPSNQLSCRFGQMYAVATYLSMSQLACQAPGPAAAGPAHVQVSTHHLQSPTRQSL